MKFFKILLALFLLYISSGELVSAERQLGTYFSVGVLLASLTFILICGWLLGSAFTIGKFKVIGKSTLKYMLSSLSIFLVFLFVNNVRYKPEEIYAEVNGIKVNIGSFDELNRRFIKDNEERRNYCLCVAEKLTSSEIILENYENELKAGKFTEILSHINENGLYDSLEIQECVSNINISWTAEIEKKFRENIIDELKGTDIDQAYDIQKYSDLLITEFKNYPFNVVISDEFQESDIANEIKDRCLERSIK